MDDKNNAIHAVADCKCGTGKVRVHAVAFKHGDEVRYYADCTACNRVTGWHETEADALIEMDGLEGPDVSKLSLQEPAS